MKTIEQLFEELISTIENNSVDNKAEITNVKLWASSWREELRQSLVSSSVCQCRVNRMIVKHEDKD
jgi:hypothetical protein